MSDPTGNGRAIAAKIKALRDESESELLALLYDRPGSHESVAAKHILTEGKEDEERRERIKTNRREVCWSWIFAALAAVGIAGGLIPDELKVAAAQKLGLLPRSDASELQSPSTEQERLPPSAPPKPK